VGGATGMEIRMGQRTSSYLLAAISETISVVAEGEVEQSARLFEYTLCCHHLFLLRYLLPLYVKHQKRKKTTEITTKKMTFLVQIDFNIRKST
jgi:hypothetical protein